MPSCAAVHRWPGAKGGYGALAQGLGYHASGRQAARITVKRTTTWNSDSI